MSRRVLIILALAAAISLILVWRSTDGAPETERVAAPAPVAQSTPAPQSAATPVSRAESSLAAGKFDAALAALAASNGPASDRLLLAELRAWLQALDPAEASRAVQTFLATAKDAATRLDLTIGEGGALADASSLRVFLLDILGQIDRAAAGALAKEILRVPTAPDEWAVSLRNVAWADSSPTGYEFLRTKTREMLRHAPWQQQPTAGFLEAFDLVVYARDFAITPQLATFVRDRENRALGHAAYLTVDRLAIADPAAALAPLVAQPELMEGREKTRANFLARADLRAAPQRELVERYLLDPRRSADELKTFAGLFPNANFMVSKNLLTHVVTPTYEELAARDRAALVRVEDWLSDPRFERLRPQLETMRGRLRTFVEQTGKANDE